MQDSNDTMRPSPDALLAEAGRAGRGRLKIFLGAAPGVGKTYEMLSVAQRKRGEGVDVVVGIVETHGRPETEKLIAGLEVLPRRALAYRDRRLEEFDLDAALARRPQLILVDELAHTNVPGSRHARRYQDVEELLDAGIDVYTTLNVQHLESYNDLVERITGVAVRETVPDAVLEKASDIELIDLPPDDLLERLRQGKVYVPDQARRAIENFFTRGNLLALRELAFRAAAERVDDELATFMRARAIQGPWPARGRLVVLVDASESAEALVRTTKRLADQRHVPWTALFVQTLGTVLSPREKSQLESTLALAESLGAETASVTGMRVGAEVLAYARDHNVAQVLVGRPRGRRLQRLWRGSLADWLVDNATGFEITVAASEREAAASRYVPWRHVADWLSARPAGREVGLSLLLVAAATAAAWALRPWLSIDNLALLFLLAVTLAGGLGGLWSAVIASLASFLLYNFFFTEPRLTFDVARAEDVTTLAAFLVISIVVGQLAGRLREQAAEARRNTRRVEVLFDFSRRMATAVDERDLLEAGSRGLTELMGMRCVLLRLSDGRIVLPRELEQEGIREIDRAAADWAVAHREPAGQGTHTLPAADWHFVPVVAEQEVLGLIGISPRARQSLGAEERRLLFALQAQIATALARLRLQRLNTEARVNSEAESLRAALLASVSHDLRTPLVSIIGSISALRELESRMQPGDRGSLLDTALSEAERLDRFIQNLLDMTRLGYGALKPRLEPVSIQEILASASRRLSTSLAGRTVETRLPAPLPLVRADPVLLEQVLVNLLDNAAKYSPPGEPLRVIATAELDQLDLRVIDRGPGIAQEDRTRVFDLFYRARQRDSVVAGSGLGLPICKGFIEAMGGTITAEPGPDGFGTAMRIRLPLEHRASGVDAAA